LEHEVGNWLGEIADRIGNHPEKTSRVAVAAAADHGVLRHQQGYTIPMLLVEASIWKRPLLAYCKNGSCSST